MKDEDGRRKRKMKRSDRREENATCESRQVFSPELRPRSATFHRLRDELGYRELPMERRNGETAFLFSRDGRVSGFFGRPNVNSAEHGLSLFAISLLLRHCNAAVESVNLLSLRFVDPLASRIIRFI